MNTLVQQEAVNASQMRKVILAASVGNFIEWFDFAIYAFLATTISHVFFASDDATTQLLKTFAVFAVAFAFRPLGGLVFGILGDRWGRKRTLSMTIIIMTVATLLIGLLPSYESIGIWAAVLLTIIRCVQGFSAGGEYAGACAFVIEHSPDNRRAFFGSVGSSTTFLSFAMAAIMVALLQSVLSSGQMIDWGWRIPFLLSAPFGIVGLYLRMCLTEVSSFQSVKDEMTVGEQLNHTVRSQFPTILKLGAFISLTSLTFYTFATYFPTYLEISGSLEKKISLWLTVIALLVAAAICPLIGWFSDKYGRRVTIFIAGVYVIVAILPALTLGASGHIANALIGSLILAIGAACSNVVTAPLLSEVFPGKIRYTASAITYNLAYTIFGGTAPLVATWLIAKTGYSAAPAYYLVIVAVIALAGGTSLKDRASRPLLI